MNLIHDGYICKNKMVELHTRWIESMGKFVTWWIDSWEKMTWIWYMDRFVGKTAWMWYMDRFTGKIAGIWYMDRFAGKGYEDNTGLGQRLTNPSEEPYVFREKLQWTTNWNRLSTTTVGAVVGKAADTEMQGGQLWHLNGYIWDR